MGADTIRRIFFTPPVAVARLGGSATPMDAYDWATGDPHTIAETRVRPAWTLDVVADGSVVPRLPVRLIVRDGALLRPVAPFLELWALVGDGPEGQLRQVVVTADLLAANGATEADVTFTVEAMNRKAARRTASPALRVGTFPAVQVRGDQHTAVELRGESPPDAARPLVPRGRSVPLGSFQVLRPVPQPAGQPWSEIVRVDAVRVRFTPGRGRFYGPPEAAQSTGGRPPAVPADRAFLTVDAGWFDAPRGPWVVPADTFDERASGARSLGVVDDACDARIDAELRLGGTRLRCRATVAAGPPHFAPDRRPFLSLADELNDRQHDPGRDTAMTAEDRDAWVEDLFERIFETVADFDVDFWRSQLARNLPPAERRQPPISGDGIPEPNRAMGGADRLRDPEIAIPAPSDAQPQPLAERARERHRNLSDLAELRAFVRDNPDRVDQLVRRPFGRDSRGGQSMQMPPFMVNSNANALALAWWQYDLLMAWVRAERARPPADAGGPTGARPTDAAVGLRPLSAEAAERRRRVLEALGDES